MSSVTAASPLFCFGGEVALMLRKYPEAGPNRKSHEVCTKCARQKKSGLEGALFSEYALNYMSP